MFRVGQVTFFALAAAPDGDDQTRSAHGALIAGTAKHRVAYVGVYLPSRLGSRALARYLSRMP
jgi:hypothetical protein